MNCPTEENFEFYASSPSVARQLTLAGGTGSGQNSPKLQKGEHFGSSLESNDGLLLEVFSESKRKPQITYTENGRRLVNGKLEDADQPDKLWTRLIVDSVTSTKLRRSASNSSSSSSEGSGESSNEEEEERAEGKKCSAVPTNGKQKLRQRFSLGALFTKRTKSTSTMLDANAAAALAAASRPSPQSEQQKRKKLQRQEHLGGGNSSGLRQITCIAVNGNSSGKSAVDSNTIAMKKLSI